MLNVAITMPPWTVYRSTDHGYVYQRFMRLGERWHVRFVPPRSRSYVLRWNAEYARRRVAGLASIPVKDQAFTPRIAFSSDVDVVFSYGLYPDTSSNVPVVWEQTFAPQQGVQHAEWVERVRRASAKAASLATRVVTATDTSAEWFCRIFPQQRDKVRSVPYYLHELAPVATSALQAKQAEVRNGAPLRVLFVGKEARRKGLVQLVEAWQLLPAQTRVQLEVHVVSAMLDGQVRLPAEWRYDSFVSDVNATARAAHLLAFPTQHEAYGLVLVEAMAAGCVPLTTHAIIQRSIAGAAGLFVDPAKPAEIADALSALTVDRERVAQLMSTARERYCDCYAPDSVGERYVALLAEAAGKERPDPIVQAR